MFVEISRSPIVLGGTVGASGDSPINNITGNTTITSAIAGNLNTLNITGNVTLTVDNSSIANVTSGTVINFLWQSDSGSNAIDFATGGSQTIISLDSNVAISGVGGAVSLVYLGSNTWSLIGALA